MKEITEADQLSDYINKSVKVKMEFKDKSLIEKWFVRILKNGHIGFECPEKNDFMSWMFARKSGYKIFIE